MKKQKKTGKIEELEKRIEQLEKVRCCGGCGHMPSIQYFPQPVTRCQWCGGLGSQCPGHVIC